MVWKFITGGWRMKIVTGLVGSTNLVIIFFASSRSAIVGIVAGCVFVALVVFLRATSKQRKRFLRLGIFATAVLLLGIVVFVQNSDRAHNAFNFFDQILQLTNDYRGVGTGFSGRIDRWHQVMHIFSDGTFLIGKGIRYTDISESEAIDNSYLVILYEIGLVPLILIVWRYFSLLRRFIRAYFRADDQVRRRFYLTVGLLLVVLLVSNITERYLFGVGNPYSLIAFLLFASPSRQVDRCLSASTSDLTSFRPLANWPAASSQLAS
jgi:O-antigen ligase